MPQIKIHPALEMLAKSNADLNTDLLDKPEVRIEIFDRFVVISPQPGKTLSITRSNGRRLDYEVADYTERQANGQTIYDFLVVRSDGRNKMTDSRRYVVRSRSAPALDFTHQQMCPYRKYLTFRMDYIDERNRIKREAIPHLNMGSQPL